MKVICPKAGSKGCNPLCYHAHKHEHKKLCAGTYCGYIQEWVDDCYTVIEKKSKKPYASGASVHLENELFEI